MKKVKEFLRDIIDDNPFIMAIITIVAVGYLLQVSGFIAWHHDFVEAFWKAKGF